MATARQLPALAPAFSEPDEALWAGHQAAVMGALPWESAWLSADGQLGGEIAGGVRRSLSEGGLLLSAGEEPDHVGIELAYLGHLCAAEAEALSDGQTASAQRAARLCGHFWEAHLGRWLPPFVVSVREAGSAPWTAVAELALELCTAHGQVQGPGKPWGLQDPLPDPHDAELGLWGIVRALVTPARSGWLPSAAALDRLAEASGVPSGIGERKGRLELIFRSAALKGTVGDLFLALDAELAAWSAALPGTPWADKALASRQWLAALRSLHEDQREGR